MTPQPPSPKPNSSTSKKPTHKKLPRLPPTQKIQKRPLLHPPIAAPRTGASTEKVIYVSSSSPFISTVKRVRSYLSHIETRAAGPITLGKHASQQQVRAAIEEGIERARGRGGDVGKGKGKGRGEEVLLKATGKAIERLLGVALYFQGQEGVKVELRTGSVGAVDDVVETGDGAETGESQLRRVSCLEVGVRLV
ncbi:hypothetical protein L207DRAFT_518794 [Hyaloscypha variabilis F]|uniref:Uncharacterized protein n=1 Tax=Hyaloscypha variabilis (strain UAMH 11265 / GT02V1 / F) TaxID=1149755 RepID=A0A2J6R1R6_HYAVF|nr:hypothetical protein L207DRAFT_518794 [Hyaloscypha variabilis F]